jgi:hypothetical protein
MEEIKTEESINIGLEFYNDVKWDLIKYNKIQKEMFLKIRSKYEKVFATFLGAQDQLAFYMFKPISWEDYKAIMSGDMPKYETHDYIIEKCLLWPTNKSSLDAGIILTLVYQILAQSSFLKDPSQALKMIIEI